MAPPLPSCCRSPRSATPACCCSAGLAEMPEVPGFDLPDLDGNRWA
jgi:hypothetical protein